MVESSKLIEKVNKLLVIFVYILSFIFVDSYGIFFYISIFLVQKKIIRHQNSEIEKTGKMKFSKVIQLMMIILTSYLLMYMYTEGKTDKGLEYLGLHVIPTYTILFYLVVPPVWNRLNRINKVRINWKDAKKNIFFTVIISAPIIINDSISFFKSVDNYNTIEKSSLISLIYQAFIVSALVEEIFFRGFAYTNLKPIIGIKKAQVISALVFMFWHINLLDKIVNQFSFNIVINLFSIFLLGYINSIIYEKTKSLVPCVVLHSLINGGYIYTLALLYK